MLKKFTLFTVLLTLFTFGLSAQEEATDGRSGPAEFVERLEATDLERARELEDKVPSGSYETERQYLVAIGARSRGTLDEDPKRHKMELSPEEQATEEMPFVDTGHAAPMDLSFLDDLVSVSSSRAATTTLAVIEHKTSCAKHAGTNSRIEGRLQKSGGWTEWRKLDNKWHNDRKRCARDVYFVTYNGSPSNILQLRTNSSGLGPAWKLLWERAFTPTWGWSAYRSWDMWLGGWGFKFKWCLYNQNGSLNGC